LQLNFHAIVTAPIASRSTHFEKCPLPKPTSRATVAIARTRSSRRLSLRHSAFSPACKSSPPCSHLIRTTDMRLGRKPLGPDRKGRLRLIPSKNSARGLAFCIRYDVEVINPFRDSTPVVTRDRPDGVPAVAGKPQEQFRRRCSAPSTAGSAYVRIHGRKKGELKAGENSPLHRLSADLTKVPPPFNQPPS